VISPSIASSSRKPLSCLPALEFMPALTPEVLAENRAWMRQAKALDDDDVLILCFPYVIRTPHHTILVDSCIGNDKPRPRPKWNMKTDDTYMRGAFTFGRGKDDAVFSGDLMHSPLQTLYPELSIKFDVDQAQAAKTRRSFLDRYCDTDTLCCPAHFPSPSVGKIRRKGNAFVCAAV
jgi:hypothetical protein